MEENRFAEIGALGQFDDTASGLVTGIEGFLDGVGIEGRAVAFRAEFSDVKNCGRS